MTELILDGFKSYPVRTSISGWDSSFNAITGLSVIHSALSSRKNGRLTRTHGEIEMVQGNPTSSTPSASCSVSPISPPSVHPPQRCKEPDPFSLLKSKQSTN